MYKYSPNTYIGSLNPGAVEAAVAHALQEYPLEACGAIVKDKYVAFENHTPDEREDSFLIVDIEWYYHFICEDIDCIVHSHDNYPMASLFDQERQQALEVPSLIINLKNGKLHDCILFGGGEVPPIVGRPFFYGAFDCLSTVSDHLYITRGLRLPNPPRAWEFWANAESVFEKYIAANKDIQLVEVEDKRVEDGDMLFYNIHGTKYANHIGIVCNTDLNVLHHFMGRISGVYSLSHHRKYLMKVYRIQS